MSHKEDALQEIILLARRNNISLNDLTKALADTRTLAARESSSVLTKLFGYLGGIFVFSGIGVFIAMFWDDFDSVVRIIVTLGIGLTAFYMAVACLGETKYERAATPLFLMSSLLQPAGIFVMLDEFSSGGDTRYGVLYMAAFMLIQQGFTFWAKQRTVLAFSAILFGSTFFATLFDLWDLDNNLIGITVATSLICIAYALNQSRHTAIAPFWYLVGSATLLWSVFDAVKDTPLELAYLGLSGFLIFLSTTVRSRTLLTVSTLAMLGYIGYFTAEHFADNLSWPVALVIIGVALIGLSSLAVKLNNKYIRQAG